MTIKTLHITNSYHPDSGGIRTFYLALLAAANRQGRPVRLVVPAEKSSMEDVGEFGRIYYVATLRCGTPRSRPRFPLSLDVAAHLRLARPQSASSDSGR